MNKKKTNTKTIKRTKKRQKLKLKQINKRKVKPKQNLTDRRNANGRN